MQHVDDYGSGPVLALIHGSPGSGQSWKAVGERLQDCFRIVAPTLPGHGEAGHDGPVAPVETDDLAAAVEEVLAPLPGPLVLAAHSFGGNVALRVALRGRLDLSRLILLEPVEFPALKVAGDEQAYRDGMAAFDAYIAQFEAGEGNAVATMVDYWFGAGAFERMPARLQDYLRANTAVNVRDVQASFRQRLDAADLARLAMPVTVVCGTRSPQVTLKIARAIVEHVAAGQLHRLADADHAMLATHAPALAELIAAA